MAADTREKLRERSALLWDAQPRATRGPKPAVTREDVVRAAITTTMACKASQRRSNRANSPSQAASKAGSKSDFKRSIST